MTGKIALIWRGPMGSSCEFGYKALQAQNAGAVACVLMNEYPGAGPIGMSIGTSGGSVTIPVFMIGNLDGIAISAQYHTLPANSVKMTITNWGEGLTNDLGMVPQGGAAWHSYAIPANQLISSGSPMAYKALDGAFIANYGTHNATNVRVNDSLKFTPSGGSATLIHSGASPTLSLFHPYDSIYAMFATAEYNLPTTGIGVGRFDLKYTISSDSVDMYPADNSVTYSYYATDSLYSKGRYDFANNRPERMIYEAPSGGTDYLWGPMYYIAHGGTSISSAQFSLYGPGPGSIGLSSVNIYAFKWVDGSGGPLDGIVENGELSLVSMGIYNFALADTSGGVFKVQMGDPVTGAPGVPVQLDPGSWYYIAAEVPTGYFLGCDGLLSPYPRIYGRHHISSTLDYSSIIWNGDYSTGTNPLTSFPLQGEGPCAFYQTYYINSVDSFNYNSLKGMIPAIAMTVNNNSVSGITGTATVCVGASTTLSDATPGGTWSSSSTLIATVGSTGIVTGASAGTAIITYATTFSGIAIKTVTVITSPAAIAGAPTVCVGLTTSLSDATSGGTWSSGTPGVATISGTGTVTGVAPGTSVIYYTVGSCAATVTVSVNLSVAAITGAASVCVGSTTTLSDATSGGTWSSGTPGVASVAGTGVVTGVASGTSVISYTVGGCATARTITVNPSPAAITGTTDVCVGLTTILSDATGGGTWSSGTPGVATVSGGTVTGVASGTSVISYTVSGCAATATVTVSPVPAAIAGASSVCVGQTTLLNDATTGGTWTSDNTAVATVSSGTVSGLSSGTVNITYATSPGCFASLAVTINPLPIPAIIYTGNTLSTGSPYSGYQWLLSGAPISGATNATYDVVLNGPYSVTVSDDNGCMGTSAVQIVVNVGVKNINATGEGIILYPNPNGGSFTVNVLSGLSQPVMITIKNIVGKEVKKYSTNTNTIVNINLNIPAGIYFLSAIAEGKREVVKVIVQ